MKKALRVAYTILYTCEGYGDCNYASVEGARTTPGPWIIGPSCEGWFRIEAVEPCARHIGSAMHFDDIEFIIDARSDIPRLLDAVEEIQSLYAESQLVLGNEQSKVDRVTRDVGQQVAMIEKRAIAAETRAKKVEAALRALASVACSDPTLPGSIDAMIEWAYEATEKEAGACKSPN